MENTERDFEFVSREEFAKRMREVVSDFSDEEMEEMYKNLQIPQRASGGSAGYDIISPFKIGFLLNPGEDVVIPTGLKAYMPLNERLSILPRSGHGFKYYIRLANTEGVIDSDYYNNSDNEGHIMIKIRNEGSKEFKCDIGKAFCQAIFEEYKITKSDKPVSTRQGGLGHSNR